MRNGHIGYINDYLYTDVQSYEVFQENGKTYAVKVEKIQACKPESVPGGFCCHFTNLDKVWGGQETREVGQPFEIVQHRGHWGRWGYDVHGAILDHEDKDAYIARDKEWKLECGDTNAYEYEKKENQVLIYRLTKSGKRAKKFYRVALSRDNGIEEECKYFEDYNF